MFVNLSGCRFLVLALASLPFIHAGTGDTLLSDLIEKHNASRVCAVLGDVANSKNWNLELLKEQSCEGCDEGELSEAEALELNTLRAFLVVASPEKMNKEAQSLAQKLRQANPGAALIFYSDLTTGKIVAIQKKYSEMSLSGELKFEVYSFPNDEDFCVIPVD